jgi:hypothetical protein
MALNPSGRVLRPVFGAFIALISVATACTNSSEASPGADSLPEAGIQTARKQVKITIKINNGGVLATLVIFSSVHAFKSELDGLHSPARNADENEDNLKN